MSELSSPNVSLIVAFDQHGLIGRDGDLPWRLSSDLKRFKELTMGHCLIMGRKTLDSIGRLLPGRTTIVLTRNPDYEFGEAKVALSPTDALAMAKGDTEPFVVGGSEIYRALLPHVRRIYLTRVETSAEGDTFFPEVHWDQWTQASRSEHPSDAKNEHAFAFEVWERNE